MILYRTASWLFLPEEILLTQEYQWLFEAYYRAIKNMPTIKNQKPIRRDRVKDSPIKYPPTNTIIKATETKGYAWLTSFFERTKNQMTTQSHIKNNPRRIQGVRKRNQIKSYTFVK